MLLINWPNGNKLMKVIIMLTINIISEVSHISTNHYKHLT